ncbi:MAG TPA: hypothetical protein VHO03_03795 [Ignavibacteriales bacterium]|nr:hypothetical protein [Ignavibacteriales bacterium]
MDALNKDIRKRQPSNKKLYLMNCDSYLFTIPEAALLCRKNKDVFLKSFLKAGYQLTVIDGEKYIRHADLKMYQEKHAKIQAS